MKKRHLYFAAIGLLLLSAAVTIPVFANSSWRWLSETRPYDLLPIAIVMTLTVEILAINYIPWLRKLPQTALWVTLGNLMSFGSTYLFTYMGSGVGYSFEELLEYTPVYTIGIWSLLLTISIEIPLVQWKLGKDLSDKKKAILIVTILCVNAMTTALVFIMERSMAPGHW